MKITYENYSRKTQSTHDQTNGPIKNKIFFYGGFQLLGKFFSSFKKMASFFPKEIKIFFLIMNLFPEMVYGYTAALIHFVFKKRFKTLKEIKGQTVLISGAGNGIGRQLAIEFSNQCTNLVLLDLDMEALKKTSKMLNESSKCHLFTCDVSDRSKVYETAKIIRKDVGKVDILVNNAGIVTGQKFLDLEDEKIEKLLRVNTLSHFWMCKAFLPDMIASNHGHLVSIASLAGLSGFPRLSDYCSSKFGAVGLMESLILEFERQKLDGVKVTIVCPSLISTGLFEGMKPPLTVNLTPEYVASKVVDAVRENKELLILPPWCLFIIILKWTMPHIAVKHFYQRSGLLSFMDDFKGRNPNSTNQEQTGERDRNE